MKKRGISCFIIMLLIISSYIFIIKNSNDIENKSVSVKDVVKVSDNGVNYLRDYYNNKDIMGIISINGNSMFNYPIVQGNDNDYYLNHDYYGNDDLYGSVVLDYRSDINNSRKILIYGHSSVKRDIYFNELESYYDKSYYNEYRYITIKTDMKIRKYEIFSVYVETSDFTYMNMNFNSDDEWYSHISHMKNNSLYDTGVNVSRDDNILILQTCSNNNAYKDYAKKYLLVIGREIG